MAHRSAYKSLYDCTFGPDENGEYVTDVVYGAIAHNCGTFCTCQGLVNNACFFGPDESGNYISEIVSSELADSCDRASCICDTHPFEEGDLTYEMLLESLEATDGESNDLLQPDENEGLNGKSLFVLIFFFILLILLIALVVCYFFMKKKQNAAITEVKPVTSIEFPAASLPKQEGEEDVCNQGLLN